MYLQRLKSLAPLILFILISPFLFRIRAHSKIARAAASPVPTSIAAPLGVPPDLDARLAKFQPIDMPFSRSGLSDREQHMVSKLVDAANRIEQVYWRQSDPEGLKPCAVRDRSEEHTSE